MKTKYNIIKTRWLTMLIVTSSLFLFNNTGSAQNCQALFTYTVTSGTTVQFADTSFGGPFSYFWTFGDATSSTVQNPSHTYSTGGAYLVCLTITTTNGCTSTYCDSIWVGINCDALWSVQTSSLTAFFNNFSLNFTNVLWDFGDNSTTTAYSPTHTYANTGTYTVCLTGWYIDSNTVDTLCTDMYCQTVIIGSTPNCVANFTYVVSGLTVFFTDASTPSNQWFWNFGDGNTAFTQNTSHTYASAGTYTVTLVINDSLCSDTVSKTITVSSNSTCTANFSVTIQGNTVAFVDNSTGTTITGWSWDFDDGNTSSSQNVTHTYVNPGIYNVCLTVFSNIDSFCYDVYCQPITIGNLGTCVAGFSYVDSLTTVAFMDTSTGPSIDIWLWDLGDGNTSTVQHPTHTYALPGTYTVCLTVSSTTDSTCLDMTCMNVTVVGGSPTCDADFSNVNDTTTAFMVHFTDQSTGFIVSWLWDFGDQNFSTQQDPTHLYQQAGTYTVCLGITDSLGCTDSLCKAVTPSNTIGIQEPSSKTDIVIYPNPVYNLVTIELSVRNDLEVNLQIINTLGQVFRNENRRLTSGTTRIQIPVNDLSQGIYMIKIDVDGKDILTRNIIVQN